MVYHLFTFFFFIISLSSLVVIIIASQDNLPQPVDVYIYIHFISRVRESSDDRHQHLSDNSVSFLFIFHKYFCRFWNIPAENVCIIITRLLAASNRWVARPPPHYLGAVIFGRNDAYVIRGQWITVKSFTADGSVWDWSLSGPADSISSSVLRQMERHLDRITWYPRRYRIPVVLFYTEHRYFYNTDFIIIHSNL